MKLLRNVIALALAYSLNIAPTPAAQNSVVIPTTGPKSMAELVTGHFNPALQSLFTCNAGNTPPNNGIGGAPQANQCWWDTSAAPNWVLKWYDGIQWVGAGTLNTASHAFSIATSQVPSVKSGASYPIVDADKGSLLILSNSGAVTSTIGQAGASSQFQAGWYVDIKYTGSATYTITPTTSTIDSVASLVLQSGQGVRLISDGTNYVTFTDWGTASTGQGAVARATSPVFATPTLGAATATSLNGNTITTGTGTLTLGAGKTATVSNTLTFSGTDGSTLAVGAGGTVAYVANNLGVFASTTSAQLAGVISNETGSGLLVFNTSPTITTPTISSIINSGTITLPTSTDTLVGRATTDTLTNKTLGSPAITGTADVQGAVAVTGDISPTQINATTNDYAPTGFSTASVIRITTDASRDVTGLAGGTDGRVIIIYNAGSFPAVLKDEGAGSSAANRFGFGADLTLAAKQGATLIYDSTAQRWRQIGGPSASGGGSGTVTQVTCNGGTTVITSSGTCASRDTLTANRTYYVRTDGNDTACTGLINAAYVSGSYPQNCGLLTVQRAANIVYGTLDLAGFNVTIQVVDGTYTGALLINSEQVGAGDITLQGNSSTPANVLLSITNAEAISVNNRAVLYVKDLKITTATFGHALRANNGGSIIFQNIDFGAAVSGHMRVDDYAVIRASGSYTISGSSANHWVAVAGIIRVNAATITLTGTPAFSNVFANCINGGVMHVQGNTFSGSATGSRYNVTNNSVIITNGAGASYLPGNAGGTGTNAGTSPYGLYN